MRLLLDTHAFFWWLKNASRLSTIAHDAISTEDAEVFESAVSALEISSKVRIGKWPEAAELARTIELVISRERFIPLAVTVGHAKLAGAIAGFHRDPFDRLLAAQAISDDLTLVTNDPLIGPLGAKLLW